MLRSAKDLERYVVHAAEDEIGRIHDLYFDDHQWTIRHLVISTGGWLTRHRALVPLASIRRIDDTKRIVLLSVTRDQVANGPGIDSDRPVSHQHEVELHRHYGFPYYVTAPFPLKYPHRWTEPGDPHLRSAREVTGYLVREIHDDVGRVADFLVDDTSWTISYLIVDTGEWWPGKQVLVSPGWVEGIRWEGAEVVVGLSREAIRGAPAYDASRPVDRDYETRLRGHYGRPDGPGRGPGRGELPS